jgi:hypothetical protein
MSALTGSGGPDDSDAASWATESLPLAVRKELLERELRKLGFRRAESRGAAQQQQQPQGTGQGSHPQAEGNPGDHAD